ncbi:MAG TPA: IPT/TIG domain-containing protein [Bryobacteraceae bacterium]|nr:IPT/TIG domain-containing protein [Bryobacteraceae bacterium]
MRWHFRVFRSIFPSLALILSLSLPLAAQLVVDTVAGGGSEDGIPAAGSHIAVSSAAACADGSTYVTSIARIYRVTPDGILHLYAGTGVTGFSGDGGPALAAKVWNPLSIACYPGGGVVFADLRNNRIRRIDSNGVIQTVAGNGLPATAVTDGDALSVPSGPVYGLAVDSDGSIYIAEGDLFRVRKIGTDGSIRLFAGAPGGGANDGDGGPAASAHLSNLTVLAVDAAHNVYIGGGTSVAPTATGVVRRVSPDGAIGTVIGSASASGAVTDGADAATVSLPAITSMAFNPAGDLLIGSQTSRFDAWRVTPARKIFKVTGLAGNIASIDAASNVYFYQSGGLNRLAPDASVTAVAGSGSYYWPDGTPALTASFNASSIGTDPAGHLLIGDRCLLRMVDDQGKLKTLAGNGACGSVAPGPALATPLASIAHIASASDGTIYFSSNGSVYRIDSAAQIAAVSAGGSSGLAVAPNGTVYAAQGSTVYVLAPGKPAVTLTISGRQVLDLAVDGSGTVYAYTNGSFFNLTAAGSRQFLQVPDGSSPVGLTSAAITDDNALWFIFSSRGLCRQSCIDNVGLGNSYGLAGDGGSVESAYLNFPNQLAEAKGNIVYVLEKNNRRIRRITGSVPASPPVINVGGAVSSASYKDGAMVASGEIVTIFGDRLARQTQIAAVENNQIPSSLGSTKVYANGLLCPILSVSPGQVNAIVPQRVGAGSVALSVAVDGIESNRAVLAVADSMPGFFTADASGSGPGAIVNQDGTINSASNPAPRGSVVSLYGSGAGVLNDGPGDGFLNVSAPFGTVRQTVTATVGGQNADVAYAGGAPFLIAGAIQVNLRIPAGATAGAAAVEIMIGSMSANRISVWVQ